jgi:hypothetical protein
VIAKGVLVISVTVREKDGHDANKEAGHVREHVHSIGHHCKRVRQQATRDLGQHEEEAEAGADEELALSFSQRWRSSLSLRAFA